MLSVTIDDNGIGIAAGDIDKIYDFLYRGNNAERGSGIGLYLVKQAVDKLGGAIRINSGDTNGTKVVVDIPEMEFFSSSN